MNSDKKEGRRDGYQTPQVMSYTSKQLLELLGPAQGYGSSPGGGPGGF